MGGLSPQDFVEEECLSASERYYRQNEAIPQGDYVLPSKVGQEFTDAVLALDWDQALAVVTRIEEFWHPAPTLET